MPGFLRVNPLGEGAIRGPARLIVAPSTIAFPSNLNAIINMSPTSGGISGVYAAGVQSLSVTGTPTGGTFTLAFQSVQTAPIAYNASAAAVQTALNAISTISSQGGVTCSGGPLPATPVVITFGVNGLQPAIIAPPEGNALTAGTTPAAAISVTTAGNGQYDVVPGTGWTELGSTRGGVNVTRNNTEDQIEIDQVYGSILGIPNEWEMTVATQLADTTLENIQTSWECGSITTDLTQTPIERHLPFGNPTAYTTRRLAVLHQKSIGPGAGLIRAVVFRLVTRSPQNSQLDYMKTGQTQTIAQTFRAYVDTTISDPNARLGHIIEQQV